MAVLAPDGTVTRTMPAGSEDGETAVTGRHFSVMFAAEDRDAGLPDLLLEAALAFGISGTEGWRTGTDGSRVWWEVKVRSVHDSPNPDVGFVALLAARPEGAGLAAPADPVLVDLLFNRVFAVGLTLRRVAGSTAPQVVADRVEAAIEEIDAAISDLVVGCALPVPAAW